MEEGVVVVQMEEEVVEVQVVVVQMPEEVVMVQMLWRSERSCNKVTPPCACPRTKRR